jgi:putative ABC transport system substrate-binding protein
VLNVEPLANVTSQACPGAIVDGLRDLGWIDGKGVQILWRSAEGSRERLQAILDDLVRLPVDVLVVFGNPQVEEAMKRTKRIPIVMAGSAHPDENGLVKSLARPGGNVTGLALDPGQGANSKRLGLLKEAAPTVSRVAFLVPWRPEGPGFSKETEGAARALGLSLFLVSFDSPEGFAPAIAEAVQQGANGLVLPDWSYLQFRKYQHVVEESSARHRMPVIQSIVNAEGLEGLLAYGPDMVLNCRRTPHYIDRILKGAKPGDLPVEQLYSYQLVVNLKAAKAIGVAIPGSLLIQANRVIE